VRPDGARLSLEWRLGRARTFLTFLILSTIQVPDGKLVDRLSTKLLFTYEK